MRTAVGILTIIGGIIGTAFGIDGLSSAIGPFAIDIVGLVLGIVTLIGGIFALKVRVWGFALAMELPGRSHLTTVKPPHNPDHNLPIFPICYVHWQLMNNARKNCWVTGQTTEEVKTSLYRQTLQPCILSEHTLLFGILSPTLSQHQ